MDEEQILQYIEYDDKLSHEWFIFQGTEEGTIYDFYKEYIRPDLDDRILALTIENDIYYEEAETLIDDEDYWVLTDKEADEKAELEGEYLLEHALSEIPDYLHRYFDSDQYLKDQVSYDRGYVLNTHNGSEESITLDNGSVYYIYRRN
jgi:hypothetical protein